jgi:hypothetical protein
VTVLRAPRERGCIHRAKIAIQSRIEPPRILLPKRRGFARIHRGSPSPFQAAGLWYEHFEPTSDDEVRAGLVEATRFPVGRSSERRPEPRAF